MAESKTYLDIGHGDPDSILWLYANGFLDSRKTGERTHESVWGFEAMNYWRGRFDPKTNEISVAGPIKYKGSSVPQWLEDKLEEKFGTGLIMWRFNPMKPGKRVK